MPPPPSTSRTARCRALCSPGATIIGMPVAVAWDVVTFPFQAIFGVYPYGSSHMAPR